MARKLPPQHRADVAGIYIPANDTSIDKDRFYSELERMKAEGLDPEEHPIRRYYRGLTRFDLQAQDMLFGQPVKAGDYFGPDAERWVLRRLSWDQWYEVTGLWKISDGTVDPASARQAQLRACRYGIAGVEGTNLKLDGAQAGSLTHGDMQRIFDLDRGLPPILGDAIIAYSLPLSDQEKKA
ncbi:hypothetical protein [Nannocystis sp. SCPEA4]|uniref:hypothetical protein n=1 Tax=Nannocystis sp. SCPEA4 TaxID=2996787 RepID=UPI00227136EE|nr:hypothetical protein [Nannocystis sp. SCPEA4]MCY1055438.1 hypothetical protein [Nannocystis sp. SCPEA4]